MRKFTKILFWSTCIFLHFTRMNGQALNLNNGIFTFPAHILPIDSNLTFLLRILQTIRWTWWRRCDKAKWPSDNKPIIAGFSVTIQRWHSNKSLSPLQAVYWFIKFPQLPLPSEHRWYQSDPLHSMIRLILTILSMLPLLMMCLNTGIDEIQNATLATASPNPANNLTGISYALPVLNNARLVISNLLGNR